MESLQKLVAPLQKLALSLRHYLVIIGVVLFGVLAATLILQTSSITSAPANDDAVAELVQNTGTPRIDDKTAAIIESLGSQNIVIDPNINNDRDNPFAEN